MFRAVSYVVLPKHVLSAGRLKMMWYCTTKEYFSRQKGYFRHVFFVLVWVHGTEIFKKNQRFFHYLQIQRKLLHKQAFWKRKRCDSITKVVSYSQNWDSRKTHFSHYYQVWFKLDKRLFFFDWYSPMYNSTWTNFCLNK